MAWWMNKLKSSSSRYFQTILMGMVYNLTSKKHFRQLLFCLQNICVLEYEILIWWEFWFLCTESEPQGVMVYEIWVTSLLLQKAIAIAQKASKEDQDGNYEEAILSYQHAVKYFLHIVKRGSPWLEIKIMYTFTFTQKHHTAETFQVILRVCTRSSVTVIVWWTN